MDLSIIIVSWNCRERLRDNLQSLLQSTGVELEILVVDNASTDGTVAMIGSQFPTVRLIANDANLGFAAANNQALKLAQGDFLLLLNPDMRVEAQTLSQMLAWMKRKPEAWVTGFKLLTSDGQLIKQVRRFPRLFDQLAIVSKLPHLWPSILDKYIIADFDYQHDAPVDSIRGSCFLLPRQTLEKVGYLDERFFVWFEEVDYCQRVWRAGGEVWYSAAAQLTDYVGQSFKLLPRQQAQRYFADSMIKYFAKWRPKFEVWVLKFTWTIVRGLLIITAKKKK